ncbi:PQQ-binding-like beta-propeller repeat protein [Haloferula sp.]|uniref:outer membrane protein assembly factor BamB family protein n=1 Tax=Haloferula sp. TaxID=2497595 RepID=UPI00329AF8B0
MIRLVSFSLVTIFSVTAAADFSQWPEFRGPTGQGLAEGGGPGKWSKTEGVVWKNEDVGKGWAGPLVVDDLVVLATARSKGEEMVLSVLALDRASGEVRWERELFRPTEEQGMLFHSKNSYASGTPVVADGVIYAHFSHMGTAALDLKDGKVLWKQHLEGAPKHGTGSSPVVVGDLLVVNVDAEPKPRVVALNRENGEIVWETARGVESTRPFSYSTPLLIESDGQQQIVSTGSEMVGAYRPKDGKLLWEVRWEKRWSQIPRPVSDGKLVYLATGFMTPNVLAIDPAGAEGDVTETHVRWDRDRHGPKTPSFVCSHKCLYVIDDTGMLSGVDKKTGENLWQEKLFGNFSASLVLVDHSTLYAFTEDGVAYIVKVSPESGKVVFELDMEERVLASPAIVGGALYLRTEEALWRIEGP